MDNTLQLLILTKLKDQITAPLNKMKGATSQSSKSLKELQDKLHALERTQNNIKQFRELAEKTNGMGKALNTAQAKAQQLGEALNKTATPTKTMRREFETARQTVLKLKASHQKQSLTLQRLRSELGKSGISTKNLSNAEISLRSKIAQTNQALTGQRERLSKVTQAQNKLAKAKEKFKNTKSKAVDTLVYASGTKNAGEKALSGIGHIMQPGVEFSEKMSKVQALTRLDKNSKDYTQLETQARELGAKTMFSATDAAEGQSFLAMAGFKTDQIIQAMPGMLNMAKAGNLELGRAADISSNILSGMKIPADQMGKVSDVLVATFTRSNTDLEMLGDTMKYVAPVASSLGVSLEELGAAAGKLGDAGIQASMAGTSLKTILNRLAGPPKSAQKALAKLNIETKDSQGNLRNFAEILTEIYKKTKTMGSAEKIELLKGIAGEEAVSSLTELIEQAGTGKLQQLTKELQASQGVAQQVANTMGDNITGDLDELSSAWEDVGITIEKSVEPSLRSIIKSIAEVVNVIGDWLKNNPTLTTTLVKLTASLAIIVTVLSSLFVGLAAIAIPLTVAQYTFATFSTVISSGIGIFGKLATAIKLIGTVITVVGNAMLVNPIVLIIAAIIAVVAGLAYVIYKNWDWIKATTIAVWQAVCSAISTAWEWIKSTISSAGSAISGSLSAIWNGISSVATQTWNWIKNIAKTALDGIIFFIMNFTPLGWFIKAIEPVKNFFNGLPADFVEFGKNMLMGLVNGIKEMAGQAYEAISNVGSGVIKWFRDKLNIHSPSRVFEEFGKFIPMGLQQGISKHAKLAINATKKLTHGVISSGLITTALLGPVAAVPQLAQHIKNKTGIVNTEKSKETLSTSGQTVASIAKKLPEHKKLAQVPQVHFDKRPSLAKTDSLAINNNTVPLSSTNPPNGITENITINIFANGMNPQELAKAIRQELDNRTNSNRASLRSGYIDYGV